MNIKKSTLGWKYYLPLLLFGVAGIFSFDLTFEKSIKQILSDEAHDFLVKKFDLATFKRPVTRQIAEIFTSLPNAVVEKKFPYAFDELRIDIKFKHLEKILADRNSALLTQRLPKTEFVPAKLTLNNQKFNAKLRLKGHLHDHWATPDRWSFRIKLKGGKSIYEFNAFSLQKPRSRKVPYDHLFQHWLRSSKNLSPRHKYVKVFLNGEGWGVMDVEEHMSKQFLELAKRKEGPIMQLDTMTDVGMYNSGSYEKNEYIQSLYSYAVDSYRSYQNDDLNIANFIDVDSFAKALIGTLAWRDAHTLYAGNSKFYLNPNTLKFEVITTDQNIMASMDTELPGYYSIPEIYINLMKHPEFRNIYNRNFKILEDKISVIQDEHRSICEIFPLQCPQFDFDLFNKSFHQLKSQGFSVIDYLIKDNEKRRAIRNKEIDERLAALSKEDEIKVKNNIKRHVFAEHLSDGRVQIFNSTRFQVEVIRIDLVCQKNGKKNNKENKSCNNKNLIDAPIILQPKQVKKYKGMPPSVSIAAPDGLMNNLYELNVVTKISGTDRELHSKIEKSRASPPINPMRDRALTASQIEKLPFVSLSGDALVFSRGSWVIDRPLILPQGISLSIPSGTTLRFHPDAYIIVQGAQINAMVTSSAPIILAGHNNKSWKGMYVINSQAQSKLSHVTVSNTDFLRDGALRLTGGVTFYRSPVAMESVLFDGSVAEDALNIVHSDFVMEGVGFANVRSDAFDSDFSTGKITSSSFVKVGGDGLDMSGSNIIANDIKFANIIDKAISVGENSNLTIDGADIKLVGSGIVSKDGSKVQANNVNIRDYSLFAAMSYRKKSMYGTAEMRIVNSNVAAGDVFNQIENTLILGETPIPGQGLDVDKLYAQGPMKKVK